MKEIHDIAGAIAGVGCSALIVGVIDQFSTQANIGTPLRIAGLAAMIIGVGIVIMRRRTYGLRSAMIVGGGVIPFALFGCFLVWRIGLSVEQEDNCRNGEAEACRTLGERRFKRRKLEDAQWLFGRGCELEDPESCLKLASLQEAKPDKLELIERACDLDNGLACYRLYLHSSDESDLERACALDYRPACIDLERLAPNEN